MMDAQKGKWLILVYRIPPEPSRYRVSLWRTLKESGAVYIQNSVSVLPDTQDTREKFIALSQRIQEYGGESILLTSAGLSCDDDERITLHFNHERDVEYGEVIEEGQAFLEEIEKETRVENFIYAELEENEGNLERLMAWLDKIKRRDFFGSGKRKEAEALLSQCTKALNEFAIRVEGEEKFL